MRSSRRARFLFLILIALVGVLSGIWLGVGSGRTDPKRAATRLPTGARPSDFATHRTTRKDKPGADEVDRTESQKDVSIRCRVESPEASPLDGARVWLLDAEAKGYGEKPKGSAITDSRGVATLRAKRWSRPVALVAHKVGYLPAERVLSSAPSSGSSLEARLRLGVGETLRVRVQYPKGKPVRALRLVATGRHTGGTYPPAKLCFRASAGSSLGSATTDVDGCASFSGLAKEPYLVLPPLGWTLQSSSSSRYVDWAGITMGAGALVIPGSSETLIARQLRVAAIKLLDSRTGKPLACDLALGLLRPRDGSVWHENHGWMPLWHKSSDTYGSRFVGDGLFLVPWMVGADKNRSVKLRLRPEGGFRELVVDVPLVSFGPEIRATVYKVARSDPDRVGAVVIETSAPPAWGDDRYLRVELRQVGARYPTVVFGVLAEKADAMHSYRVEVDEGEYQVDTRGRGSGHVTVVAGNTTHTRLDTTEERLLTLRLRAEDREGRELRECDVRVISGDVRQLRDYREQRVAYQRPFPYGLSSIEAGASLHRGVPYTIRIPEDQASIDGRSPAVTVVVSKPGYKPFSAVVPLSFGHPANVTATLDEK